MRSLYSLVLKSVVLRLRGGIESLGKRNQPVIEFVYELVAFILLLTCRGMFPDLRYDKFGS